jgi:hypothetical protein
MIRVRMIGVDTFTGETVHWIDLYRWRWLALIPVWLSRIPQGGQYKITAELID